MIGKWNLTIVGIDLNLWVGNEYKLSSDVALAQLAFHPDIICNWEDMEGCNSTEYNRKLSEQYIKYAATEDEQRRGVSCWVKREYKSEKVYSMSSPHFMHVKSLNNGITLNLGILRIRYSDSSIKDFKRRYEEMQTVVQYIDSVENLENGMLIGNWNHGVIAADQKKYLGKSREFYNYQMIEEELKKRDFTFAPIEGRNHFRGYPKPEHLAISPSVKAENTRYEEAYPNNNSRIGPDPNFIVSNLRLYG